MPIEHPSHPFNVTSADSIQGHLVIGPNDYEITVPRVDSALAETVTVHEDNPWYSSDGICLFSKDGTALLRCLAHVERYEIPEQCIVVEDEAFAYNTVIRHVSLHNNLKRIGNRSFLCSTLDDIAIPASVISIGAEAFAEGKNLRSVTLEEGLREIGDSAFSECRVLERINIPASVDSLGNHIFNQCRIRAHGNDRGIDLSSRNARYFIDDSGVLYRREEDGFTLMEALDAVSGHYDVIPGTVRILDRAFAVNRKLVSVNLPVGLKSIGDRAFLECESLTEANLPDGLVEIGAEGFYHSALTHLRIPATLEHLGPAALVVNITISKQSPQEGVGGRGASDFYQTALSGRLHEFSVSSFDVEVASDNPKYTLIDGFLCERPRKGEPLRAMQFIGGGTIAAVPEEASEVSAYALFGVDNLRVLRLHSGIEHIGHSALSVSYPLEMIEIDDGQSVPMRFYPAPNSSGTMAQRKAFRAGWLNVEQLAKDCDSSLSFMMPGFERSHRMLLRLVNGRLLSDKFLRDFTNTVRISTDMLVGQFARVDSRQGIRHLLDLGFIDEESIAHAIEIANRAKGVSCARLLLEEKRNRFTNAPFDFDL